MISISIEDEQQLMPARGATVNSSAASNVDISPVTYSSTSRLRSFPALRAVGFCGTPQQRNLLPIREAEVRTWKPWLFGRNGKCHQGTAELFLRWFYTEHAEEILQNLS